jgi:NifU-like protein involved in Fe-S cluster formation
MVAEVRSGHDSRQPERIEISLGTWQIALKQAIKQYLEKDRDVRAGSGNLNS